MSLVKKTLSQVVFTLALTTLVLSSSSASCNGAEDCAVSTPSLLQSQRRSASKLEDPLSLLSSQIHEPTSAAEAEEMLRAEADAVEEFVVQRRAAQLLQAQQSTSRRTQATKKICADDDNCLQVTKWWGSRYTCANSMKWCDSYADDMHECCPVSCGTCPAPTEAPKPMTGSRLFFTMPLEAEVLQMGLDGTKRQPFITASSPCPYFEGKQLAKEAAAMSGRPEFLAVDSADGRVFWSDWLGGTADADKVQFNASVLSSPIKDPQVDPVVTSAFYRPPPGHPDGIPGCDGYTTWACPPAGVHAAAGGTGTLPITRLGKPTGVSVDGEAKMVYWSDAQPPEGDARTVIPKLQRASYDGFTKAPEDVVVAGMIGEVVATAVDSRTGSQKIYWVENVNTKCCSARGDMLLGHQIRRANLDGTGMEVVAYQLTRFPIGFALDLQNDFFYWTELVGGRIQRCPLDGCPPGPYDGSSTPEEVLKTFKGRYSSTTPTLGGLAVDAESNLMYWTEDHTSRAPWGGMVKSAKLDGSDVKVLYEHKPANSHYASAPFGIALLKV